MNIDVQCAAPSGAALPAGAIGAGAVPAGAAGDRPSLDQRFASLIAQLTGDAAAGAAGPPAAGAPAASLPNGVSAQVAGLGGGTPRSTRGARGHRGAETSGAAQANTQASADSGPAIDANDVSDAGDGRTASSSDIANPAPDAAADAIADPAMNGAVPVSLWMFGAQPAAVADLTAVSSGDAPAAMTAMTVTEETTNTTRTTETKDRSGASRNAGSVSRGVAHAAHLRAVGAAAAGTSETAGVPMPADRPALAAGSAASAGGAASVAAAAATRTPTAQTASPGDAPTASLPQPGSREASVPTPQQTRIARAAENVGSTAPRAGFDRAAAPLPAADAASIAQAIGNGALRSLASFAPKIGGSDGAAAPIAEREPGTNGGSQNAASRTPTAQTASPGDAPTASLPQPGSREASAPTPQQAHIVRAAENVGSTAPRAGFDRAVAPQPAADAASIAQAIGNGALRSLASFAPKIGGSDGAAAPIAEREPGTNGGSQNAAPRDSKGDRGVTGAFADRAYRDEAQALASAAFDVAAAAPLQAERAISALARAVDIVAPGAPASTGTAAPVPPPGDVQLSIPDDNDLRRQIVQAIKFQWRDGAGDVRLTLQPEYLGDVAIALRVEQNGGVTAHVNAGAADVRAWISANEPLLRQGLAEQGLTLDRLVVAREQEDTAANHEGQRRQPQQEKTRDQPKRRETAIFEVIV
jgi:flagellar hook-length control protein FliK